MEAIDLNFFKKYGPIAYLLLVFLGLLYKSIFFIRFNIVITNYIDLSEALFFLYGEILIGLFFVIFGIIISRGFKLFFDFIAEQLIRFRNRPVKLKNLYIATMIILGLAFFAFLVGGLLLDPLYCLSGTIGAIGYSLTFTGARMPDDKFKLAMIFLATLVLIWTSYYRAERVVTNGEIVEAHLLNDAQSNVGNVLIGETRNFVFLYNKKDSTSVAISRENIQYLRFKDKSALYRKIGQ